MDWDSEIKNDGQEFKLFPAGSVIEFEVTTFDKARTKNNDPMAKIKLSCEREGEFTLVHDQLVLMASCEWKLCQFFTAIGQRKHGETLKPKWNKVQGSTGYAVLGVREYTKDGKLYQVNEVDKYLEPDEGKKRYAADRPEQDPPAGDEEEDNLNFN